jgi:GNAT superfamily N-acetyltransferase
VEPTEGPNEITLSIGDMPGAMLLSEEAGWNQIPADWAVFMEQGRAFGIRTPERLVASAAILPLGGGFGWISMVLVTADWRRRGLASHLMTHCVEELRSRGSASLLDATPQGALVYGKLGFRTQCGMNRWRGQGGGVGGMAPRPEIVPRLLQRDAAVFGGNRSFLLENFLGRPDSFVVHSGDDFIIGRRGRKATQLGPLIAGNTQIAAALLDEAILAAEGPVIVDLLEAGAALEPLLLQRGFDAFRTFERMLLDRDRLPGLPGELMVAAGPEFG